MPIVPNLNIPKPPDTITRKPRKPVRVITQEEVNLKARRQELGKLIAEHKKERAYITQMLKNYKYSKNGKLNTVKLYALTLEDGCWYVGMSYNVTKRFIKHKAGKGANWTKLHKPIEVVEVRETVEITQESAAKLEDDMTIEYAMKYGSNNVRGGGYCQRKPRWPDVVVQNEMHY